MCRGPLENATYEFTLASSAVSPHVLFALWMVLEMGGKWPFSCCFMGCCLQDLFNLACCILVQFPSSFSSKRFVSIHTVHPYNGIDTTTAWKISCYIFQDRSEFHMINSLLIEIHTFTRRILISVSVDEILLPIYVNLSTNFRELPFRVEKALSWLKELYSIWPTFLWRPMPPATCFRLCIKDLAWVGVFARSATSSA